jgi:SAM-dependent methyltransferase
VADPHDVRTPEGVGRLLNMDAEALALPDESFDLALSLSSFEHFGDGARVLQELHRVLVPGGAAFVSFEPIWTCSYGHHLHHLPELASLVAPWAHLLWTPETMRQALLPRWPARAELSLDQAVHWVYEGPFINRLPIDALRRLFERSPFEIEWQVPLRDSDEGGKPELARYLERLLPWSADELMTIGFSILLVKRY